MAITSPNTPFSAGVDPRPQASIFQRLCFSLTLRVYGNSLLTHAGRSYLFTMTFLMFVVSVAEGLAWGYFGTQISSYPWVSGIGMGLIVCLFMWFFDRALMTADYMQDEHTVTLQGKLYIDEPKNSMVDKLKAWLFFYKAYIFRIGLATASLLIVAPYVSELAFYTEIQNKQREYFYTEVQTVKQSAIQKKQAALIATAQRISELNTKYQDEVSGKLTGIRGRGEAAKAIERELNIRQPQYQQQQAELANYIQRVEQAVAQHNVAALTALGIRVNQDSSVLRKKAVNDIKSQHPDEYWQIESSIRVLLAIFAVGLFSMKWMQPRPLKLYFSSLLQQQWNLYCLGKYDTCLPTSERREWLLNSQDALPEEFERMIVCLMKDTTTRQQREEAAIAEDKAVKIAKAQMELEQRQIEQARQDALKAESQALNDAHNTHLQRLAKQKALTERRELERDFFEQKIALALADIDDVEADYLQQHGSTIDSLKQQETELINQAHELDKEFKTHQERVQARDLRIQKGEQEYQEIQQELNKIRQRTDRDSIYILRTIADMEFSLSSQADRLERQRAELLGFEANQKFYLENSQLLTQRLGRVQQQLCDLQQPLQEVSKARATVKSHHIQFLLEQGLQDSPHHEHSEEELPHLVDKLRRQLQLHVPTAHHTVSTSTTASA